MSPDATARWTFDGRCEPSDVERVRERSGVCENAVGYVQRRGVQRPRPDEYRLRDEKRSARINFRGQSVRTRCARQSHDAHGTGAVRSTRLLYTNMHDREINAERRHPVRVLLLAQKTDTTHDASSEHTHPHKARFIRHHTPQSHKTVTTYASTYASLSRSVARRRRAAPL